jgi:hypothetical protein
LIDIGTTTTTINSSPSPPSTTTSGEDDNAKSDNKIPPLAVATQFEIWNDDESSHDHDDFLMESFMNQRQDILDLLQSSFSSDLNTSAFLRVGLPPVDATDFSFWALRFCLAESDVASRQHWLAYSRPNSNNNHDRDVQDFLQFVLQHKQDAMQEER